MVMENFDIGEYTPEHIQKAKQVLLDVAEEGSLSASKKSMVQWAVQ